MHLRIAARIEATCVEGPGRRFALWVQGCTLACPGCCNPDMFAARGGQLVAVDRLAAEIDLARRRHAIEGITVLGGEPLQQLGPVAALCRTVAARGLGVIVFTGFTDGEARARPGFQDLWGSVDTLVTGRYDRTRPEPANGRRFVGSANQELVHRTTRYRDPRVWSGVPAAEVHVGPDGSLRVLGAPGAALPLVAALDHAAR